METNKFIASVHSDYLPFLAVATDEDLGKFIRAQICISAGEEAPALEGMAKALLEAHTALIERLNESKRKKVEAGKRGGNPALKQGDSEDTTRLTDSGAEDAQTIDDDKPLDNQTLTTGYPMVNQCLTNDKAVDKPITITYTFKDKEKDKESGGADAPTPAQTSKPKPPRKSFKPPTVEEVAACCMERGNGIDPAHFVDYNASKGWMVGKSPMKDWRAAIRNWERNGLSGTNSRASPPSQDRRDGAVHPDGGIWFQGEQLLGVLPYDTA
jgi:hypothetical protein